MGVTCYALKVGKEEYLEKYYVKMVLSCLKDDLISRTICAENEIVGI